MNKEKTNQNNNRNNNDKHKQLHTNKFFCLIPIDPTKANNDINNRITLWIILIVIAN
jgi:hypothetical protein